jgi:hypothetical protein
LEYFHKIDNNSQAYRFRTISLIFKKVIFINKYFEYLTAQKYHVKKITKVGLKINCEENLSLRNLRETPVSPNKNLHFYEIAVHANYCLDSQLKKI